jgi:hypothetical protein
MHSKCLNFFNLTFATVRSRLGCGVKDAEVEGLTVGKAGRRLALSLRINNSIFTAFLQCLN